MTEATQKIFLYGRQKLLLALLHVFGGHLPKKDLQKYLFLFTQMCQKSKSYEFVPYKYGCFSFQSDADLRTLMKLEIIQDDEGWAITSRKNYLSLLHHSEQAKISDFFMKFKDIKGNKLIRYVYKNYPYYAIKSEIASALMTDVEIAKIEKNKNQDNRHKLFTIGYEGSSIDNYLNRLVKNHVKMLCDVRKNPMSRKYGFSRSTLSETLAKLGIDYVHIPELGIVSEKRQNLMKKNDYSRLFHEYEKITLANNRDALDTLYRYFLANKRMAITCFEAEHRMCHRSRVAEALTAYPKWQYSIEHL